MLGYDDVQSVSFFGTPLPGLWSRAYDSVPDAMAAAYAERAEMARKSAAWDRNLTTDLVRAGGAKYAALGGLAFRQGLAATKLVWVGDRNTTWAFLKEISSDGDMSTVDVIFPTSPLLLYTDPMLLRMLLAPVLAYANNETATRFSYPFSPHQLGQYPIADSRTEDQEVMPLENSGNMLLMLLAVVQRDPGHDTAFFSPRYWPMLTSWADVMSKTVSRSSSACAPRGWAVAGHPHPFKCPYLNIYLRRTGGGP